MTPMETIIYIFLIMAAGYTTRVIQEFIKSEDAETWFS
jgi:hypothetical protein